MKYSKNYPIYLGMMLALKMHAIMFRIYKKTVRNYWDIITDNCVAMHYNVPYKGSAH